MSENSIVMTTVADAEQAGDLARSLVGARLAACVQVVAINSVYRWDGDVVTEPEQLLVIKTTTARYPEIAALIEAEHPYDEPELIRVDVAEGSAGYLGWIAEATHPG